MQRRVENTWFLKNKKNWMFASLFVNYKRYNDENLHVYSIVDRPAPREMKNTDHAHPLLYSLLLPKRSLYPLKNFGEDIKNTYR